MLRNLRVGIDTVKRIVLNEVLSLNAQELHVDRTWVSVGVSSMKS